MLCDCVQVATVGNSYRYLGTPTFDGRYLGTLDIKVSKTFYISGTQVPILLTSSAVPEVPMYPYFRSISELG